MSHLHWHRGQFAILEAFMPMLADTGGNTGIQSATLAISVLALREISPRDVFRILTKETQVALILGTLLCLVCYGRVMICGGETIFTHRYSLSMIGIAVAMALGFQLVTATLIGAVLPLAAAKLKLDPAFVASPALTTIVDIIGLWIFFRDKTDFVNTMKL